MELYFLKPSDAYIRLQDLHINRGCTKAHYGMIREFNGEQKTLLIHLMKQFNQLLASYPTDIGKVEFVLLDRGVYWDFPFTWNKTIIAMTPKIFERKHKDMLKILCHEWVHLDQRRNPSKYHQYYRKIGFHRQRVDFGGLTSYILRNPDADQYEWVWTDQDTGHQYAPVALLYKCKFLIYLLDHTGTLSPVERVPAYYERFGTKRQLYHPNEITAHLIADKVVDGVSHYQVPDITSLIN